MNTIDSVITTSPFGKAETCARLTIEDITKAFNLSGIAAVGEEYTLSFWLKAEETGPVGTSGGTFTATPEWRNCVTTFTAESVDVAFGFGATGTYYIYHPQLEVGNKATAYVPAPEDTDDALQVVGNRMTEAETKILENAEEIALRASKVEVEETLGGYYTKEETDAQLKVQSEQISLAVSQMLSTTEDELTAQMSELSLGVGRLETKISETEDGMNTKYTTLEQTVNGFGAKVANVETGLSKTLSFDEDGFVVRSSDGSKAIIDGGQVNAKTLNLSEHVAITGVAATASSALSAANSAASLASGLANGTARGTFIDGTSVISPEIIGGTITGAYLRSTLDGAGNVGGEVQMYYLDEQAGGIRLDNKGAGTTEERQYRMFVYTDTVTDASGKDISFALKIRAAGGMSIDSGDNIYMTAPNSIRIDGYGAVSITSETLLLSARAGVTAQGSWNFSGATVTGLNTTAVFA